MRLYAGCGLFQIDSQPGSSIKVSGIEITKFQKIFHVQIT